MLLYHFISQSIFTGCLPISRHSMSDRTILPATAKHEHGPTSRRCLIGRILCTGVFRSVRSGRGLKIIVSAPQRRFTCSRHLSLARSENREYRVHIRLHGPCCSTSGRSSTGGNLWGSREECQNSSPDSCEQRTFPGMKGKVIRLHPQDKIHHMGVGLFGDD